MYGYKVGDVLFAKIEFRTTDPQGRSHLINKNDKFIITDIDDNHNFITILSTKFVNINYNLFVALYGYPRLEHFTGIKELRRKKIKNIENEI